MKRTVPLLLLTILLAALGCADPRSQAASELVRFNDAVQRHLHRYGRLPATSDAGRPESPTNLVFTPQDGVEVRLTGVAAGRYSASARRKIWLCWSSAGAGDAVVPDCAPTATDAPKGGTAPPPPLRSR